MALAQIKFVARRNREAAIAIALALTAGVGCSDSSVDPAPVLDEPDAGIDSGNRPVDPSAPRVLHEQDFANDSNLRLRPQDTLIVHLEPAGGTPTGPDVAESGVDEFAYEVEDHESLRICMPEPIDGRHRVEIIDPQGQVVAELSSGQPCLKTPLQPGDHSFRLSTKANALDGDAEDVLFVHTLPIAHPRFCTMLAGNPDVAPICAPLQAQDGMTTRDLTQQLDIGQAMLFDACPYGGPTVLVGAGGTKYLAAIYSSIKLGPETVMWGYDTSDYAGQLHTWNYFPDDVSCLWQNSCFHPSGPAGDFNDAIRSVVVKTNRTILFETNKCESCDLKGATFSGLQLSGVSFKNANLTAAQFRGTTLTSSTFAGADLTNTDFTSAITTGVTFDGATMTGTVFASTEFTCASFAGTQSNLTDVTQAKFDQPPTIKAGTNCRTSFAHAKIAFTSLPHSLWKNLDLSYVAFQGFPTKPNWSGVDLSNVKIVGMNLDDGTFTGTTWKNADLTDVHLADAILDGGDFTGATLKQAHMSGVQAKGAIFTGAFFQADGTWQGATLSYAHLTDCKFDQANLSDAVLNSVDLHGPLATLAGANLTRANLAHANLSSMDLSSVSGQGANLSSANLVFANLTSANFSPASTHGGSLSGAYLCGAQLDTTDLTGTDLTNAAIAVAGDTVKLPDGTQVSCPPAVLTNVKTSGATTCPDHHTGPCTQTQWTAPAAPPAPCCVSDGTQVCPARKQPGYFCTDRCECYSESCVSGKCG